MSRAIRTGLIALAIAFTGPTVYEKLYPVSLFIRNHPSLLPSVNVFPKYKVKFENDIRNCEDIVLDEARGAAIFSCDPGRDNWNTVMGTFISATDVTGGLFYYKYPKYSLEEGKIHPLQIDDMTMHKWANFHPLGLGYHPQTRTLYVSNHAEEGPSIEVLTINKEVTSAKWERMITHPLMRTPNSILPISDHEIYFTNDHKNEVRYQKTWAVLETYLRLSGGSVIYMNLKTNEAFKVASLPFANGIAQLNKTHIAVASTTGLGVRIFEVQPDKTLALKQKIHCDFWVDNLKVDGNGKLLISGHPHAPSIEKVSKGQHKYQLDASETTKLDPKERPRAPSWVTEWDGNAEGKLRDLYIGDEYGTSTSAVRDVKRGVGFIVGLYEKGLLQWEE